MPGAFQGVDAKTSYTFMVHATGEAVVSYYQIEMPKLGFLPIEGEAPPSDSFFIIWAKPGSTSVPMNFKRHGATTEVEILSPR